MLVHYIDPSQPEFSKFVQDYQTDLQNYATFLNQQYSAAVNGIVKTDIPSYHDILGWLGASTYGGSPPQLNFSTFPSQGWAWNGVYGAVDTYPDGGLYAPSSQVLSIPATSLSYLIDLVDISGAGLGFANSLTWTTPEDWVLPWVTNRLLLGTMARWKAIFLLNGYDKALSILEKLYAIAGLGPLPTSTLTQDNTLAIGDWSARELFSVLKTTDSILAAVWRGWPLLEVQTGVVSYSIFSLTQCLDNIANGSWSGPPPSTLGFSGQGAARPLGLRSRIAAAAL